uniref:Uncharacterized protein n=1 Tax=Aegilops tauschii TaxID=37682 RepID=M8CJP0_AEGTA
MAAGDATHAPPAAEAQSLVESFCAVTSATPDEAAFFLEGHNWALEAAVRSFYDNTEVDADGPDPAPQTPPAVTYLENNKAGITVFGFTLDRSYLHTMFMLEWTLFLWLLGITVGFS